MTTMPQLNDVETSVRPDLDDTIKVYDLIERMEIHNNVELQTAVGWIAEVKVKYEEVEAKRKTVTEPLNKALSNVNALFKPVLDGLKKCEVMLKNKIVQHTEKTLAERDNLLTQVATSEDRVALVQKAEALAPPKIDGLSVRETWTGEIIDMPALVQWAISEKRFELLSVDEKALIILTKTAGRDLQIPGFKAEVKRSVAVTASKVQK